MTFSSRQRIHRATGTPLRLTLLAAAALLLGACSHTPEEGWARIKTYNAGVPLLYTHQAIIISIDGHAFGGQYRTVRVRTGYHEVHAVFVDCELPALVVTCFHGALEVHIPFVARSGVTYVLQRAGRSAWIEPAVNAARRLPPSAAEG